MNSQFIRQDPATVNQVLAQIHDLQDKVNSFNDAKEFHDPEHCEQLWSIPRSQSNNEYFESKRNDQPCLLLARSGTRNS